MKILAIDTSTDISSVALYVNNGIIDLIEKKIDRSHSGVLAEIVDNIIKKNSILYKEIDYFLLSIGPGSYSGLKVGSSFLKGLTLPIDKPIVPINSLDAINSQIENENEYLVAIYSHRDYFYCQKFLNGKSIDQQLCKKISNEDLPIYGYQINSRINFIEIIPSSSILIDYFIKNKDMYINNLDNQNISPIYLETEK